MLNLLKTKGFRVTVSYQLTEYDGSIMYTMDGVRGSWNEDNDEYTSESIHIVWFNNKLTFASYLKSADTEKEVWVSLDVWKQGNIESLLTDIVVEL